MARGESVGGVSGVSEGGVRECVGVLLLSCIIISEQPLKLPMQEYNYSLFLHADMFYTLPIITCYAVFGTSCMFFASSAL